MKKVVVTLSVIAMMSCEQPLDCHCETVTDAQTEVKTTKGGMSKGLGSPNILSGDGTEANPYMVSLSGLSSNIEIDALGDDSINQYWKTKGDVNLNGRKLTLRHVQLAVTGNLNGGGTLEIQDHTRVCVKRNIQNNPTINIHDTSELLQKSSCDSSLGVIDYEHFVCPKGQVMVCE